MKQTWVITVTQIASRYRCDECSKGGSRAHVQTEIKVNSEKPILQVQDGNLVYADDTQTYGWPLATVCCWTVRRERDTRRGT